MRNPETTFLQELATIERTIRFACRRASFDHDTAEDFASYAKLKLIENDYAIITRYERRASFAAFISVVMQRLLLDYRIRQWGRWHASSHATRLGEVAVVIEMMLQRDGRTVDEALPALQRRWPDLTRQSVEALAQQLPARTRRPRAVDLDLSSMASDGPLASETVFANDRLDLSRQIAAVVRFSTNDLAEEDRLILRLRFEADLSVAMISRTLGIPQKPLYRRIRRSLLFLRQRLEAAGVRAEDAEEILRDRSTDLDFGFEIPTRTADLRSRGSEEDPA